jgi:hypothetical protein
VWILMIRETCSGQFPDRSDSQRLPSSKMLGGLGPKEEDHMKVILGGDPRRNNNHSVGTEMIGPLWPEATNASPRSGQDPIDPMDPDDNSPGGR